MDDNEQLIRERAHEIWIEEGRPDGKDREHWQRACKEITGSEEGSPASSSSEGQA